MCGFVGWVNVDTQQPVELSILKNMNRQLSHRGPDDEGYFLHQNVGLAHRRLSIIDTSQDGRQPLYNEDESVAIVFNGEIYNYDELKQELSQYGHRFRSHTDTETIVHGYEQWGPDVLKRLDGMFSLALFDRRNHRLLLARDRFGQKPLYYTLQNGMFLFGSELKAFFPHPQFEKALEISSVSKYLAYQYVPTPHTIFQQCWKLAQASYMLLDTQDFRLSPPQSYWKMFYEPKLKISEPEALEEFSTLFTLSVKKRLMSDVPLGVFLSGGVDSSSVVATMADLLPPSQIKTFSIGFAEASFDESSYAAQLAAHFQTDHHEHILSSERMLETFPRITGQLDEPFADESIVPTSLLCEFSRRHVTVALGGDGSDELLAGYEPFGVRRIASMVERLPAPCLHLLYTLVEAVPGSEKNRDLTFKLKHFLKGFTPETKGNPELRNSVWLGAFPPDLQQSLFSSELSPSLEASEIYQDTLFHAQNSPAANSLDRLSDTYLKLYLHDDILVKVDRASMMHSLEVRSPFLDTTLAEFLCRLPAHLKIRTGIKKYLLKKAMAPHLPAGVITRSKQGFGMPYGKWCRGPLKEMLLDTFADQNPGRSRFFDRRWVRTLLSDFLDKRKNTAKEVWTLFLFELWKQQHKL